MPKEEKHSLKKPKKYKIVISKDALLDIKTTKFHDYGNPSFKRPNVLAIHYKENAENQQIILLQSSRFGEALRIVQDHLNSKNFYAVNPAFDNSTVCCNSN